MPAVRRSEPSDSSEPTIRRSDFGEPAGAHSASPEDTAAQPDSSLTTIPDEESSVPTMVPPSASPITFRRPASGSSSPLISIACQLSVSVDQPLTERSMRVGATRVAIKKATRNEKSFSVERLDPGQRLPVGMMEAMLVFAEEIDDSPESETEEVGEGSKAKRGPEARQARFDRVHNRTSEDVVLRAANDASDKISAKASSWNGLGDERVGARSMHAA